MLDKNFNEVIPKSLDEDIGTIYFNQKCFTFKKDGKEGLKSFDFQTIIEPKYECLYALSWSHNLFIAEIDNKQGIVTTDGNIVLPFKYEYIHLCKDNRILCKVENGHVEMFQIENILGK